MRNRLFELIERRTLRWANRKREAAGLPTLAELPLGRRRQSDNCPLAHALPGPAPRVLPRAWSPTPEHAPRLLPPAPMAFLWLFDTGRAFLHLRIPGWLTKLQAAGERSPLTAGEVQAAQAVERDREPTAV